MTKDVHEHRALSRRGFLRVATGAATTAALAGSAACRGLGGGSGGEGDTLSLTWWTEGKRAKQTREVLRLFEKQNEGVKVDAQFSDFAGYYDKLATRVAGGNPPDVFQLHITTLSEYAKRGAVRSLDDLVPDPLGLDDLPAEVRASCLYKGELHFVPLGLASAPSLVYSRTKLDRYGVEPPEKDWSLADFKRFAAEISKASRGKVYGTAEMGGNAVAVEAFARNKGIQLFEPSGDLALSEDMLTEWLTLWKELRDSKACVPMKISAGDQGFATNPLTTGQAALTLAASSKGIDGYKNLVEDDLEAVPFPRDRKGGVPGTLLTPIEWWAISAKIPDDKAKLAAKLCNFVISEPRAVSTWGTDHGVPVYPDLRQKTYPKEEGTAKQIYDDAAAVAATKPKARVLHPSGAGELLNNVLPKLNQDIGFGKKTVAQAVRSFFSDADRVLA